MSGIQIRDRIQAPAYAANTYLLYTEGIPIPAATPQSDEDEKDSLEQDTTVGEGISIGRVDIRL